MIIASTSVDLVTVLVVLAIIALIIWIVLSFFTGIKIRMSIDYDFERREWLYSNTPPITGPAMEC